jgi:hypothetical protein
MRMIIEKNFAERSIRSAEIASAVRPRLARSASCGSLNPHQFQWLIADDQEICHAFAMTSALGTTRKRRGIAHDRELGGF